MSEHNRDIDIDPTTATLKSASVASSVSCMDSFSSEIERYYTSTRPYAEEVIEKDRLCKYIEECGKYLQVQCEKELDSMSRSTKENKKNKKKNKTRNMSFANDDRNNGKLNFLYNMKRAEKYRRNWDIFRFGSESWGTSMRDSDIDFGIFVNFKNMRPDKKYLLSELARIISENDNEGMLLIKPLLNARYPIIRIFENRLNIKIDVSIADRFCRGRNELILDLIHAFEAKYAIPIKKLIVFIKYWSKQKGINNAYQCYLNSFGYTLLSIKFIQVHLFYDKQSNVSLSFLVYKFFEFYAMRFKPEIHSINIGINIECERDNDCSSDPFDQKTFNHEMNSYCFLEIRDPINPANNIAQRVELYQMLRIKQEFINAFELMKAYKNEKYSKLSLFDLLVQKNCNAPHQIVRNYQYLHQFNDEAADQNWRDRIYARYGAHHRHLNNNNHINVAAINPGNINNVYDIDACADHDVDNETEDEQTEDLSDDVLTNESIHTDHNSYNYDLYADGGLIDNGYNYNNYYKPQKTKYEYENIHVPYHKSPFKVNNDSGLRERERENTRNTRNYHHNNNTRRRRKHYRSVYV